MIKANIAPMKRAVFASCPSKSAIRSRSGTHYRIHPFLSPRSPKLILLHEDSPCSYRLLCSGRKNNLLTEIPSSGSTFITMVVRIVSHMLRMFCYTAFLCGFAFSYQTIGHTAVAPLKLTRGLILIQFNKPLKDRAIVAGHFSLSSPVTIAGLTVDFSIGGVKQKVTLNNKGVSPKGGPLLILKASGFRPTDTIPAGTNIVFTISAAKKLQNYLKLGCVPILNSATLKPFDMATINVQLTIGGDDYIGTSEPGKWLAKHNATGRFLLAKSPAQVPVLIPSANAASPDQTIALQGKFDPRKKYDVIFSNDVGFEVQVFPSSVQATSLEVSVPPYLDISTFQFSGGLVRAVVIKEFGASATIAGVADGIQILDMPSTGVPPGTLTVAFLSKLEELAVRAVADLETAERYSHNKVNAAGLRSELSAIGTNLGLLREQIEQIKSGAITSIPAGRIGNTDLLLNTDSLAVMDRLLLATWVSTAHPNLLRANTALQANAIEDPQDIADQFTSFLQSEIPQEIRDFANRFKTAANIGIGIATIGAVILTSEITLPLAAASVMSAMVFSAATFIPAAQMAALEGGTRLIENGNVSLSDFKQTSGLLFDRVTEHLVDKILTKNLVAITGDEDLVKLGKNIAKSAGAISLGGADPQNMQKTLPPVSVEPLLEAGKQIKLIGVSRFDGSYSGSFSGTIFFNDPDLGAQGVGGGVSFTVSGGRVVVTAPGTGRGGVASDGDSNFAAGGGGLGVSGASVGFGGAITLDGDAASAGGGWSASFRGGSASGSWGAAR